MTHLQNEIEKCGERANLQDSTPCSSLMKSNCALLQDSIKAATELPQMLHNQELVKSDALTLVDRIIALNRQEMTIEKEEIEKAVELVIEYEDSIRNSQIGNERLELEIKVIKSDTCNLEAKLEEANKNINMLNNKSKLEEELKETNYRAKEQNKIIYNLNASLEEMNIELGKLKQSLETNTTILDEAKKVKKEYNTYKYYVDAFSKHGIPYQIIVNNLNRINKEINNILTGLTDFNCFLENDKEDIEIFIQDMRGTRRIELCSGMERLLSSVAIRAAMTNITPLPHPSLFIIDEGFGALDGEYISNMNILLRNLKNIFPTILIITHVEAMKEHTDECIELTVDAEGESNIVHRV